MNKQMTSLLSISTLTLVTAMFTAQSGFATTLPTFDDIDADGDGRLSKQEADAALKDIEIPDVNQDGFISKYEVKLVLPDVAFKEQDRGSVGPMEYRMILQALEREDQQLRELAARSIELEAR